MPLLHIQLLGDFRLRYGDQLIVRLESPRLQSLFAYLVLHRDAPQPRQQIAFHLYPDSSKAQARTNLRNLFHLLRQALPDADLFLHANTQSLKWQSDAPFTLDVDEFENALRQATGTADLQKAVDLYPGDLIPNCYDDWILPERERLRQQFIQALARLCASLEAEGDYRTALGYAERLLHSDPLREDSYRTLMRLSALAGDRAGVVRFYNTCGTVLQRELAIGPSPETQRVYEKCLTLPAPAPAMRAPAGAPRLHNLPVQLTRFFGRGREKSELKKLLVPFDESGPEPASPARLVTLTGAGGVGKSRLALAVAVELCEHFADGVWWVNLASLADPALLPEAIASALGIRESPPRSLLEALQDYVRAKQLLLVLDNCAHLAKGAGPLAETLLRAGPQLQIVATSQHSLNSSGEVVYSVPSLRFPTSQHLDDSRVSALMEYESVQLFVDRAVGVLPTFKLTAQNAPAVAQICRSLEGIPLALELAAGRVKLLSAPQIAERLSDALRLLTRNSPTALPRHQTLRATIDWSYQLLAEKEQALLRRLSVFAGSFTLEAAEAVTSDRGQGTGAEESSGSDSVPVTRHSPVATFEVLDLLSGLVDKSLVFVETRARDGETRYRLLVTVRQYAHDKLLATGEADELACRHLAWFLDLAQAAESQLHGPNQAYWLERLEAEHNNLRAALGFALGQGDGAQAHPEEALGLAAALAHFWAIRSHLREGRAWLEQALRLPGEAARSPLRVRVLNGAGILAFLHGDLHAASYAEESMSLATEANPLNRAIALLVLGVHQLWSVRDLGRARVLLEESVQRARESEAQWAAAMAIGYLGIQAQLEDDRARARALFEKGVGLARQTGDNWIMAALLGFSGGQALLEKDYARAAVLDEESLRLRQELGDIGGTAGILNDLGELARWQKQYARALPLYEESLRLFRELGQKESVAQTLLNMGHLALEQSDLRQAAGRLGESLSLYWDLENQPGLARCLAALAQVAAEQAHTLSFERERRAAWMQEAARLAGAAEAQFEALHPSLLQLERADYDRMLADARTQIDEATFARVWAEGRAMPVEQAVGKALELANQVAAGPVQEL